MRTLFFTSFAFILFACGVETTSPKLGLDFSEQALLLQSNRLAIYFYENDRFDCTEVRTTFPRLTSLLGPYAVTLDDEGREKGVLFQIEIPVGRYVVLVDAIDADDVVIGTGCAQDQRVFEQQVSSIRISVDPRTNP